MTPGDANDRVAKNEALFREVNHRIKAIAAEDHIEWREVDFLCECGNAGCLEPIPMRIDEYELVHSDPVHFVVVPGHEHRDVDRVTGENDRFVVIEKLPGEQQVARATDPR